jgi:hypothetical protein
MQRKNEMSTINITPDNGSLTMKGSGLVKIKTSIQIYGTGTKMPVTIEADFTNIPHHLHSLYYQSLISHYNTNIVAHKNLSKVEDEPKTIAEKKSEWRLNKIVDIISKAISKSK